MSLGENIYRLRAEKRMSQGDLAEALEVSRQSISKWETDGATPELDKLVRLAELFGVTLDELVTGKRPESLKSDLPARTAMEWPGIPGRRVAAIALWSVAFLVVLVCTLMGGLLEGLILSVPFWVCGLICWNARNHAGLWCLWALFLMLDGFLRYGTGLSWTQVRFTFQWQESWNYTRLAIAWCQFLGGLGLLIGTVVKLGKTPMEWTEKRKRLALAGCGLFLLLSLPWSTWTFLAGGLPLSGIVTLEAWLQDSLRLVLLTAFLTAAVRGRRKKG